MRLSTRRGAPGKPLDVDGSLAGNAGGSLTRLGRVKPPRSTNALSLVNFSTRSFRKPLCGFEDQLLPAVIAGAGLSLFLLCLLGRIRNWMLGPKLLKRVGKQNVMEQVGRGHGSYTNILPRERKRGGGRVQKDDW